MNVRVKESRRKGRKFTRKKHESRVRKNTTASAERWEFSTEKRDRIRRGRSRREGEDVRRRRRADREALAEYPERLAAGADGVRFDLTEEPDG